MAQAFRHFTEDELLSKLTIGLGKIRRTFFNVDVYQSLLEGQKVAVHKKCIGTSRDNIIQLLSKLSKIEHKNMAKVIGCCSTDTHFYTVYEFYSNGSLIEQLNQERRPYDLKLEKCFEIAYATAKVLDDISCQVGKPIVYLGGMPSFILVDENLEPKLTGFELVELDYCPDNVLQKYGVLMFGCMLLDLFMKRGIGRWSAKVGEFLKLYEERKINPLLDDKIWDYKNEHKKLSSDFMQLVHDCLQKDKECRPNLTDITKRLHVMTISLGIDLGEGIQSVRTFTTAELNQITNNYGNLLGEGGFGKVYMGKLEGNGRQVAVKVATKFEDDLKGSFTTEVKILSSVDHKNVVKLLGYSLDLNTPILVYEYIPNGDLYDLLHKKNKHDNRSLLPWVVRLQIALGCAEGLEYMHSLDKPVVHGDLKPENILLENDLTPKLADFGLSKVLTDNKTVYGCLPFGTTGYVDPMLTLYGLFNLKSDVYALGIILLELVKGRKALAGSEEHLLLKYLRAHKRGEDITAMFDKEIIDDAKGSMMKVVSLAIQCTKFDDEDRPTMKEVTAKLRDILKEYKTDASRATMAEERLQNILEIGKTQTEHS